MHPPSADMRPASAPVPPTRPGWCEIAVGLLTFAVVGYGGGALIAYSGLDPVAIGLAIAALSGIAGLAGFAAADRLRLRSWRAFGIVPVSGRWLLVGAAAGVAAFLFKGLAVLAFIALTGIESSPQGIFVLGASGGMVAAILATLFVGVLTPVGEEFLFRGVLTNALLRYGPVIGVVGSAAVFALMHGISIVLPAAFVAGLVAGELFRRSGSVWPGVVVHVVFNLPTIPVLLLASAAA